MTTQTNIPTTMAPREQTYRQSSAGEIITVSVLRGKKNLLCPNLPEQQKNIFHFKIMLNQISKPSCVAIFNDPQVILF